MKRIQALLSALLLCFSLTLNAQSVVDSLRIDVLLQEGSKYYACGDTRFHLRKVLSPSCASIINGASYDGVEDGLYYYLQERLYTEALQEVNYNGDFNRLVDMLEEKSDYVFMDLQSHGSLSTLQQLEAADLVVVSLKQDKNLIKDFFKHYGSIAGKCIFFLSCYKEDADYLKRDFVRDYLIHPERIAIIPYNHDFVSSISDGRAITYIIKNLDCGKKHKQYRNITHLRCAAKLLYKALTDRNYVGRGIGLDIPEAIAN